MCAALLASFAFAQERTETTVEEEYLSTVEDIIITELTAAPDYDSKVVALDYLETAVNDGRASPEMAQALHSLAGEGVFKESRTNGRVANNFPDVRARACELLGAIGDDTSRKTLTEVVLADNEPMVTIAAIKALGNIDIENTDEVVNVIAWSEKKFAVVNPTPSLAYEVLNAYEKLAGNVSDNKDMIRSISAIAVNQSYPKATRDRALKLLNTLKGR